MGLTIPYGATVNGTQWIYTYDANDTVQLTQPPAKQVSLTGTDVSISGGATLDLSGGGDLYAYEFIAGEGGSIDVLNPSSVSSNARAAGTPVYTYAIVPGLGSSFAPLDVQYAQGLTSTTAQTITLSGVPGLAAGTYALLPARYALLPGAFAVEVLQQNSGMPAGSVAAQSTGGYVVAGPFRNGGYKRLGQPHVHGARCLRRTVRTQSQYTDTYANEFFYSAAQATNAAAPAVPADAGQLLLSATDSLSLSGTIRFGHGQFCLRDHRGRQRHHSAGPRWRCRHHCARHCCSGCRD